MQQLKERVVAHDGRDHRATEVARPELRARSFAGAAEERPEPQQRNVDVGARCCELAHLLVGLGLVAHVAARRWAERLVFANPCGVIAARAVAHRRRQREELADLRLRHRVEHIERADGLELVRHFEVMRRVRQESEVAHAADALLREDLEELAVGASLGEVDRVRRHARVPVQERRRVERALFVLRQDERAADVDRDDLVDVRVGLEPADELASEEPERPCHGNDARRAARRDAQRCFEGRALRCPLFRAHHRRRVAASPARVKATRCSSSPCTAQRIDANSDDMCRGHLRAARAQ